GEWLLRWIQTIFARHYLRSVAKHAINQVSIPISTVKALPIVIPPSDERIAICDFVRAAETRTAEIRSNIARAIDHLKEYRAALITAAVTGKIDVRDQGKAAA